MSQRLTYISKISNCYIIYLKDDLTAQSVIPFLRPFLVTESISLLGVAFLITKTLLC